MTDKIKRETFLKLLQYGDTVKTDEQIVQEFIKERLQYIPKQKLYKYRRCSAKNFKSLEENYIWMAPATEFYDTFDCTVNIDLKRNKKEIIAWLKNNYSMLSFDLAKGFCEQHGVDMRYTHEDMVEYLETCLDKNGDVIESKEAEFLRKFATQEELEKMEQTLSTLKVVREKFMQHEDSMAQIIAEAIDQMRTRFRETLLVYCMAEHHNVSSLWENYADVYKGFCIEYSFADYAQKAFEDYKNLVFLFPVTYRAKKPYFNMVPFIEGVIRQSISHDASWQQDPNINADLNMQLYYKTKEYNFEKEWRFAINNKANNKQYFPFVSAIYAGKDIKPGNLRRLCSIARKLRVPVYQQMLNQTGNGFKYEIVQEANL